MTERHDFLLDDDEFTGPDLTISDLLVKIIIGFFLCVVFLGFVARLSPTSSADRLPTTGAYVLSIDLRARTLVIGDGLTAEDCADQANRLQSNHAVVQARCEIGNTLSDYRPAQIGAWTTAVHPEKGAARQ